MSGSPQTAGSTRSAGTCLRWPETWPRRAPPTRTRPSGRPASRSSATCRPAPTAWATSKSALRVSQRRPEPELVPVGVDVEALPHAVVVVLGPGHHDPRFAPFGGELVGVIDAQVEHAAARWAVTGPGEMHGQVIAVREGVELVVVRDPETQPLIVVHGPGNVGHVEGG